MWQVVLTRRELIELVTGAIGIDELRFDRVIGVQPGRDSNAFYAYWPEKPSAIMALPHLLIGSQKALHEALVALNASPTAASPFTAYCRVLNFAEADELFHRTLSDTQRNVSVAVVALAVAEAALLSAGKTHPAHVSPAMCKRTLSYAWGKAIGGQVPFGLIAQLPGRWADVYEQLSGGASFAVASPPISQLLQPLQYCLQFALGITPSGPLGELAESCFLSDVGTQQRVWATLSESLGMHISLSELASSTREERGLFLKRALGIAADRNSAGRSDENLYGACAFLATRVAPGSLEHLDLLRVLGIPEIASWYSFFAAIQSPQEVLRSMSGTGLRVLREFEFNIDLTARPVSDVDYSELRLLQRVGIEQFARKFGHVGEVEVELIPGVVCSFSLPSRVRHRVEVEQSELTLDRPVRRSGAKSRIGDLLAQVLELIHELPDGELPPEAGPNKRFGSVGKRGRSGGGRP